MPGQAVCSRLGLAQHQGTLVECAPQDGAGHPFHFDRTQGIDIVEGRDATGSNHGNLDRLREPHGRFNVDALHHPIATNIGIDDGFGTDILILAGEVDHIMTGELAPAVRGHLAVAGIEPHDDLTRECAAGIVQKPGFLTAAVPMMIHSRPSSR